MDTKTVIAHVDKLRIVFHETMIMSYQPKEPTVDTYSIGVMVNGNYHELDFTKEDSRDKTIELMDEFYLIKPNE